MKDNHQGILPGENASEFGRDVTEGLEIASKLESAGFDALHIDAGCYDSWYWPHPPIYQKHGCMLDNAEKVKQAVGIPVIGVGRLDNPYVAAEAIMNNQCDIIAIARGFLADEKWGRKVRQGRVEEIRPCIGCYDGCIQRNQRKVPISCAVNPKAVRERHFDSNITKNRKRIIIIGSGPAGLQAGLSCAERGHEVIIFEKEEEIGGLLRYGAIPGIKDDLRRLLKWYEVQIGKKNIELRFGVEVGSSSLVDLEGDVVIWATGSAPMIPDINGIELAHVKSCLDILRNPDESGDNVAIIGGGIVGCEIAIFLARKRKSVTIIEIEETILKPRSLPIPEMIRKFIAESVVYHNIETHVSSKVLEIEKNALVVSKNGKDKRIVGIDTVVIAIGMSPNNGDVELSKQGKKDVYVIGDCKKPRNIMMAIWEASEISRAI
jgi:2-enoate reductase